MINFRKSFFFSLWLSSDRKIEGKIEWERSKFRREEFQHISSLTSAQKTFLLSITFDFCMGDQYFVSNGFLITEHRNQSKFDGSRNKPQKRKLIIGRQFKSPKVCEMNWLSLRLFQCLIFDTHVFHYHAIRQSRLLLLLTKFGAKIKKSAWSVYAKKQQQEWRTRSINRCWLCFDFQVKEPKITKQKVLVGRVT